MQDRLINLAKELLSSGTVNRVLGWRRGDFFYDTMPYVFESADALDNSFVYNAFCSANLSKYLISESKKQGRILVFLKPCDTYSFNELLSENRLSRTNIYVCGIPCDGMVSVDLLKSAGISGITDIEQSKDIFNIKTVYGDKSINAKDACAERCINCKSKKHVVYDVLLGDEGDILDSHRFDMVEKIENMSPNERFMFWRGELSRCIRCNACRNVCPVCNCEKCIFDNPSSGFENKAAADPFEENMFHIIRAFHVAGRCTDCGECSRVCPEHIPLHLLNRKFIKDINEFYGDYQAGETLESKNPLLCYEKDDIEPNNTRRNCK